MTDRLTDAALDDVLTPPPDGETWVIEVESLPGRPVPTPVRVRGWLKAGLRQWGLRAVRIGGVVVCDQCKKSSATPTTPQ
jgi:hypothetical protein